MLFLKVFDDVFSYASFQNTYIRISISIFIHSKE